MDLAPPKKKRKKRKLKPITPKSRIKGYFQRLFMNSREHGEALKKTGQRCFQCGVKKSAAKGAEVKLQVHHIVPVNVNRVIEIYKEEYLRQNNLMPVCKDCHNELHPERIGRKKNDNT